jgi:hypothetical protein
MTKKHFIELADTIRYQNERRRKASLPLMFDIATIEALADFCQSQNPHFNRSRWLGYIAGTNGSNGGAIKPSTTSTTKDLDEIIEQT